MFSFVNGTLFISTMQAIRQQVPGDFLEAGVWRGGVSLLARQVLTIEQQHERKVILADSFDGAFVKRFFKNNNKQLRLAVCGELERQ